MTTLIELAVFRFDIISSDDCVSMKHDVVTSCIVELKRIDFGNPIDFTH